MDEIKTEAESNQTPKLPGDRPKSISLHPLYCSREDKGRGSWGGL